MKTTIFDGLEEGNDLQVILRGKGKYVSFISDSGYDTETIQIDLSYENYLKLIKFLEQNK